MDILHTEVILTANSDFLLQYGSGENIQEELFPKGDKITIDVDSDYFVGGAYQYSSCGIDGQNSAA